jgi:zinc protease
MTHRRVVLDNGLVVIARENRAAGSIAVRLVLPAGAAFDPPGREGTAELVSGLLDRGAGGMTAEAIAEEFEFLGVSYLARARRDTLEIETRFLARHLPVILERLRLLIADPSFPEAEVGREKAQLLTTIAEREQDTAVVAEETLAATLFPPGHPYHAPRTGTRDSVREIGRDDLVGFHRDRFGPTGSVLVLAGDVGLSRAMALAAGAFASWRAPRARAERPEIPYPPPPAGRVTIVKPIQGKTQADIALGFPGPRRSSADLPAVMVLNSALGEFGLGGRLGMMIRERAGLAYYAYSHPSPGLGGGAYLVRAGVAPDRVRRALDLMRRTIASVLARGFSAAELSDSKRALASSVPRRMETNQEAAAFLSEAEFYGLGIDYPERLPALIMAVDRREVEAAAKRYLTLGRHVLVVAGPAMRKEDLG